MAYMKRYDPGYRYARTMLPSLPGDLRYVQMTVFYPSERAETARHDIRRVRDVPADVAARLRAEEDALPGRPSASSRRANGTRSPRRCSRRWSTT
jgi:predicted dehydrogenase